MTTLRESLQADVDAAKVTLQAAEAKLASVVGSSGFEAVLEKDIDEVKTFVRSIASHLFPHAPAVTAAAPAPAVTAS